MNTTTGKDIMSEKLSSPEPTKTELWYCVSDQAIAPSPPATKKKTVVPAGLGDAKGGNKAGASSFRRRTRDDLPYIDVGDLMIHNNPRSRSGRLSSSMIREGSKGIIEGIAATNGSGSSSKTPLRSRGSLGFSITLSHLNLITGDSCRSVDQFGVSDLTMDSGLLSMHQRSSRGWLLVDDDNNDHNNNSPTSHHHQSGDDNNNNNHVTGRGISRQGVWKPRQSAVQEASPPLPLTNQSTHTYASGCRDTLPPRKPGRKDSASTQSLAESISSVFSKKKRIISRPAMDKIPRFPMRGSTTTEGSPSTFHE